MKTCYHCGNDIPKGKAHLESDDDDKVLCPDCARQPWEKGSIAEKLTLERIHTATELARLQAIEARLKRQHFESLEIIDTNPDAVSQAFANMTRLLIEQALGYTPTESGKP